MRIFSYFTKVEKIASLIRATLKKFIELGEASKSKKPDNTYCGL